MRADGIQRRTIWPAPGSDAVFVIDQRALPHRLRVERLDDLTAVERAIHNMWVRGAPLIGATAAYGLALQSNVGASDAALRDAGAWLRASRPTAVNLAWAVERMLRGLLPLPESERCEAAWRLAAAIADDDVATN